MTKKLTLSIDESVIQKAKVFASQSGRSLSDLVERYLRTITNEQPSEVPDEFNDLFGSVELREDINVKKDIRTILSERHNQ